MDERELEVGDLVQLKSGGPSMTVTTIGNTDVGVQWASKAHIKGREGDEARWDYDGRICHGRFPRAALVRVES